jgi:hypothetical protein
MLQLGFVAAEPAPFTAQYETRFGFLTLRGQRQLLQPSAGRWQLLSTAGVFSVDVSEQSIFSYHDGQIRPLLYQFTNPLKKRRSYSLDFDWQQRRASSSAENKVFALEENVYDKLSYQIQLQQDVCADPANFSSESYPVIDHKRIKTYQLEWLAIEQQSTAVGLLNTVHLRQFRTGKAGENDAHIWLAIDWQCLLVRMDQQNNSLYLTAATVDGVEVAGAK